MRDETIKVVYLMDNHNLYSTITEMIEKCKSPKEDKTRAWLSDCILLLVLFTADILPNITRQIAIVQSPPYSVYSNAENSND